jgi:hypothetical protein
MASLDQPKVSAKTTGQGNWSANSRIKVLLRAPPPQTTANEGRDRNSGSTPTMLAVVKAVSVAAASSIASGSTSKGSRKIVAVERFRRWGQEERMREKFAQNRAVGLASGSSRAVPVEGGAKALQHQIVEQPIARTCVAGNWFLTRRDKT